MAKNQRDLVLGYIEEHGSITGKEAVVELGVMKLSNRIGELEAEGRRFERETVTELNRYGVRTTFMRYSLKNEL